jgi:hypothetical protein
VNHPIGHDPTSAAGLDDVTGVLDEAIELTRAQRRIDGHRDYAGPDRSKEERDEALVVRQHQQESVPRLVATVHELLRDRGRSLHELSLRDRMLST